MVLITGVSSGIGKAIAEYYLAEGETVIGFGRNNSIHHNNFTFITVDLANLSSIEAIDFSFLIKENSLILINNAGTLGQIGRISALNIDGIEQVFKLNTLAPIALTNKVLANWPKDKLIKIVNISSGAALRPIPAWASYCSSKAALDMYSKTLLLEELELGRSIEVYSLAPGVVDTAMQSKIRSSNVSTFSSVQSFIELKENNQLKSPSDVAKELNDYISKPYTGEVVGRL